MNEITTSNDIGTLEICGTVDGIRFRNESNGYTVISFDTEDGLITAVGTLPDIGIGDELNVKGVFKTHPVYGDQIVISSYERSQPKTSAAILKYLSRGSVKGIGAATAARIVNKFGDESLDIIENHPDKLSDIKGISYDKAVKISEEYKKTMGFREVLLRLEKYKFTSEECVKIWKKLGDNAVDLIEENPYILCDSELGISFYTADKIASIQDKSFENEFRIRAALIFIMQQNSLEGHSCLPKEELLKKSCPFLNVSKDLIDTVIYNMVEDSSFFSYTNPDTENELIFLPMYYNAESYSASRIEMLLRFPPQQISDIDGKIKKIEKIAGIEYAELQKEAIHMALTKGVLILTGGPGTGKTTTLNAIIKILKESGETVKLAAPTGRAAQRMNELTKCEAKTIHRMLEVEWNENDQPTFKKNEKNMISCDALIIDEVSMIDDLLFESIMRAFPLGCRLILVGDIDQLPSIGAGNVLNDLINSNIIPTVTLNEIFRQSMKSLIVTNAHKINKGELPITDVKDNDFFFLKCQSSEVITNSIIELCTVRLPKAYGYSPIDDIQVLTPSRKGELGCTELNVALQASINPYSDNKQEITLPQKLFREGDKVMQNRNNYNILWERDDGYTGQGIFNGDIGVLIDINKSSRMAKIRFDDKTAEYEFDDLKDLELAYSTTIHKSQGNEFETVIIPMYDYPPQLLYRNLLYTAVTRAKKMLILVGRPEIINVMIQNNRKSLRFSNLSGFLTANE